MNGGPGASSMLGLFQENGPCYVGNDSNSTYLNSYSWNNEVNMLYIDQPVQVGYSYDTPTNGTLDQISGNITIADFSDYVPESNNTLFVGTFPSQNSSFTANSTFHAAHALWHFAQTWFEEFPYYKPHDGKISIWTESYGGRYGPAFTTFFEKQNEKIANGTINSPGAHYIHLDTLGIINGILDNLIQDSMYMEYAYNNTYGIKAINQSTYGHGIREWGKVGGIREKIIECRQLIAKGDPNNFGDNEKVNAVCQAADEYGESVLTTPYLESANVSTCAQKCVSKLNRHIAWLAGYYPSFKRPLSCLILFRLVAKIRIFGKAITKA